LRLPPLAWLIVSHAFVRSRKLVRLDDRDDDDDDDDFDDDDIEGGGSSSVQSRRRGGEGTAGASYASG